MPPVPTDARQHAGPETSQGLEAVCAILEGVRREVGAPLEGLLAVAALMQRQPLSLDGAAHLRTITAAAQSALAYLSDLAMHFGPAGLEASLNPDTVALTTLLDEVDVLWQVQAALRGLRLITSCRGDASLLVEVDGARFKQILNALVNDAFDRSQGGVVEARLSAERQGGCARVEVRVRHAAQAGADPDQDGAAPAEPVLSGSLAAVMTALQGRLRHDANQGAGLTAVFEVVLPLARSLLEPAPEQPASYSALGHILIVDDNTTNRLVAEALCEGFGFTCETAESGEEAVEAARMRAFDIVLMDIKMPGMDGLEATRAIRELPGAVAETPILALTANADPDDVVRYQAAGMGGVVEKPIKPEALFNAITSALFGEASNAHRRSVAA